MPVLLVCLYVCFFLTFGFAEESVNLRALLQTRTQQHLLKENYKKIYLATPPRTGSTLVYNVLRYLFEDENHKPWEENYKNIVIKTHRNYELETQTDGIYVVTLRNPINACLSTYRVYYSIEKREGTLDVLDVFLKEQADCMLYLDKLIEINAPVIVLKYELFSEDFDFMFTQIEKGFDIFINDTDKIFLKKALSKENIIANSINLHSFAEFDPYSTFHGNHIDTGDLDKELIDLIKKELQAKISPYLSIFQKWGYLSSDDLKFDR